MAITREQALAEAKARGINIPTQSTEPNLPKLTVEEAMAEAQARGLDIPQGFGSQPQMRALPHTIGSRISQAGEKVSRAVGLGGDPIFQPGPLGVFAAEKARGLAQGVKEEGLPFLGETVGEAVGSKFGAKGRVAGAGFGRATGDAVMQIGQQIIQSPNAPKSVKDAATRLLKEAAIGSGTELVSEGVVGGLRRLGASLGFKSTALKPLPDFDDVARLAKEAGIDLTAAQRTASRGIDTLEEIAENAFFGRGPIRDIKQVTQPAGIRKATGQLLDSLLPKLQRVGKGELGDLLNDSITDQNANFRKAGTAIYKRVDKLSKGASVDLFPLKKFAESLGEKRIKEGGKRIPLDDVIEDLLERPDVTDFATAHRIRSSLLDFSRNAPSKKDRVVGVVDQATKMVDRRMSKAAGELPTEALPMWRTANAFWKNGKETFNSTVIKRVSKAIANDSPDKVLDVVFQAKSPKQIKKIMDLADPLTKKRLKFAFVENMLSKSTRQVPGDISDLRTLLGRNFIEAFDSFGDEALSQIFTTEEKNRVRNLGRLAKTTQGKTGGAGGFLIQLIQAAPLGAVGTGVIGGQPALTKKGLATGVPIAAFTSGLSALVRSPNGSKILTDMMNVPKGTKEAAALSLRLSREMARAKLDQKRESKKKQPVTLQQQRGFGARGF